MEDLRIMPGDTFSIGKKLFTVIGFKDGIIVMVDKNATSTNLKTETYAILNARYLNQTIKKIEKQPSIIIDKTNLPENKRIMFEKKVKFINKMNELFAPMYLELKTDKNKELFNNCKEVYGFSEKTGWQTIRKYLQSGKDIDSLISMKGKNDRSNRKAKTKLGRPSTKELGEGIIIGDIEKGYFDEAIKRFLSSRTMTIKFAYEEMLRIHYTCEVDDGESYYRDIMPVNLVPTYRQFYYHFSKCVPPDKRRISKTNSTEERNNHRLLLSDITKNVEGPMYMVEIDECETDVDLVSVYNPNKNVGRPILHCMIDVFSRMIIAVSISFDNNSFIGVTNCMLNLIDDKVELCEKYGISTNKDIWVDHFLPMHLRADYGSEYISYGFERMCNELNIEIQNASPGCGSLKGLVEQSFHQFHNENNNALENNGLIEKRHDSTHKEKAQLNAEQFKQLVYNWVVFHNKTYFKDYPLTKDMCRKGVNPIPCELWKYGCEKYGLPPSIQNDDSFRYSLLTEVKSTVSRDGVTFMGLKYFNEKDPVLIKKMKEAGTKRVKLDCRIDSRSVDNLYFLENGALHTLSLNTNKTGMEDFVGLSLREYELIRAEKNKKDKLGEEYNLRNRIAYREKQESIMKSVEKTETSSKNISENRRIEKSIDQKNNLIMKDTLDNLNGTETVTRNNVGKTAETEQPECEHLLDMMEDFYG